MDSITVSPEALRNASAELRKRSREWLDEAEGINESDCREKMKMCGEIIEEYAGLLEKISSEYDGSGDRMKSLAGEIYEQIRKI